MPGLGIRCVDDEPWVTGAESAECVMALDAVDMSDEALQMFADIQHLRAGRFVLDRLAVRRQVNWPAEQSTWTAAAVVLAADALSRTTPASGIFRADHRCRSPVRLDAVACGCEPRRTPADLSSRAPPENSQASYWRTSLKPSADGPLVDVERRLAAVGGVFEDVVDREYAVGHDEA